MNGIDYFSPADVASYPDEPQKLLLIRHAERCAFQPAGGNRDVPLTERGVQSAKAFGKALRMAGYHIDYAITSIRQRCFQTAENMAKGGQSTCVIDRSHDLHFCLRSEPYLAYIKMPYIASDGRCDLPQQVRSYLNTFIAYNPARCALDGHIRRMLRNFPYAGHWQSINLAVAHDTTLMAFYAFLFREAPDDFEINPYSFSPDYLCGILLCKDGDTIRAYTRSRQVSVNLPTF